MKTKVCNKCGTRKKRSGFNNAGAASACRDCHAAYMRAYLQRPEIKHREQSRKQRPEFRAQVLEYRQRPDVKCRERARVRRIAKTPARKANVRKYRSATTYKLRKQLRASLLRAIRRGATKPCSAMKLLGCTVEEFKRHIERQWQPGMSWDNWSCNGWHIDHIRPLAAFDLTDPAQVAIACHFTNLQPLWAIDNLVKGDSVSV